ncbi:BppU family phage baseplate upper protein [Convivina intestini]|uniref:Uncharacterized protein DUF2479 n=1 Tax=Convivina intestini TaxID=1505726 RepID=A0A2U1D4E0_9LACO|nr:BppU family phage baseplate upper protein [Convivina intestini]PVY82538.1 uncharacterized protein DUF2479 [Convivina intestini]SDC17374.1 protein of unknown function [Leuconostocaceae bacterium R-53105]
MSRTLNLSLDTTKSEINNPRVILRQGDGNYSTWHVTLTDNGDPTNLTGGTVTFMGESSASKVVVDTNVSYIDRNYGIFEYTPPKALGQDMGVFKNAYFKVTFGDKTASTASFKVIVEEAVDLNGEQAKDYISIVDGVVEDAKRVVQGKFDAVQKSAQDTMAKLDTINSKANSVDSNLTAANQKIDKAIADFNKTALSAVTQDQLNTKLSSYATKTDATKIAYGPSDFVTSGDFNDIVNNLVNYVGVHYFYGGSAAFKNSPANMPSAALVRITTATYPVHGIIEVFSLDGSGVDSVGSVFNKSVTWKSIHKKSEVMIKVVCGVIINFIRIGNIVTVSGFGTLTSDMGNQPGIVSGRFMPYSGAVLSMQSGYTAGSMLINSGGNAHVTAGMKSQYIFAISGSYIAVD